MMKKNDAEARSGRSKAVWPALLTMMIVVLALMLVACAPAATPIPAATATQAPAATEKQAATATQAPAATEKQAATATLAPAATEKPAATATQAPAATEKPAATATQAPAATEKPAATATPAPAAGQTAAVSFKNDVLPILEKSCVKCHGGEKTEARLSLKDYAGVMAGSENGPVVKPGDAAASDFVTLVQQGKMPKRANRLPDAQIKILADWVNAGAPNN